MIIWGGWPPQSIGHLDFATPMILPLVRPWDRQNVHNQEIRRCQILTKLWHQFFNIFTKNWPNNFKLLIILLKWFGAWWKKDKSAIFFFPQCDLCFSFHEQKKTIYMWHMWFEISVYMLACKSSHSFAKRIIVLFLQWNKAILMWFLWKST